MGYTVDTQIDVSGLRTKFQLWLNDILPTSNYRDNTMSELWGVWNTYLTSRANFITELLTEFDNIVENPKQNNLATAYSAWVALWNVSTSLFRCHVFIWDDLGAAAPGDQRTPQTRANEYTSGGTTGGTWLFLKANFAWNTTGLNVKPAPVSNANTDNHGIGWWPDTSTNWNNNTKNNTNITQPASLSVNQLIQIQANINDILTAMYNDWIARNTNSTWWNGTQSDSVNNRILSVKYWCHTNCHSNCHSNCHGSRSRR